MVGGVGEGAERLLSCFQPNQSPDATLPCGYRTNFTSREEEAAYLSLMAESEGRAGQQLSVAVLTLGVCQTVNLSVRPFISRDASS